MKITSIQMKKII